MSELDMLPEKIGARIAITDDECWEWQGAQVNGYGRVRWEGQSALVHRVVYAFLVGPIPAGQEIDHLCRNRACANPAHLEAVPHAENIRRGAAADARYNATHCKHGHLRTPENIYVHPNRGRCCRPCIAAARQRYIERKRASA